MYLFVPLFAADDNSAYGVAALAALVTAIGGVLVQYLSTKQTQKVQNEDRSLNEAWKHAELHKSERDEAVKREDAKDKELRQAEKQLSAARERIYFLEDLLRANNIKVPRRRPADGGLTDSDYHQSLPPGDRETADDD